MTSNDAKLTLISSSGIMLLQVEFKFKVFWSRLYWADFMKNQA